MDFTRNLGMFPFGGSVEIDGQELAKKEYCALVDTLVPGWRGDAQLEAGDHPIRMFPKANG